jgi:glucosamine--fructose-6-phosphate aminotransferase (isomerizing)
MVKLRGLDDELESLKSVDNLIIAACGTSYLAGQYGECIMRQLGCFKFISAITAGEIQERDLPKQNGGFLSISQSGETMDLLIPFRVAKANGLTRINVVNKVNSTLARENHCGVFLNCGREFSVASTKAFVCQVVVLALVAIWFAQNKNFNATKKARAKLIKELKMLSANMKATLNSINEKSKFIAEQMKDSRHIFFCGGSDLASIIAKEGALKMKELTYIHCQDLKLDELGNNFYVYLLNNPNTHVVFIVLDSQPNKADFVKQIVAFKEKLNFLPSIVTDTKDITLREELNKIADNRVMVV